MLDRQRPLRLALLLLVLPLVAAESCPQKPSVRVVTPRAGVGATFEPLFIEVDTTTWADPSSYDVRLNGVDITEAFTWQPGGPGQSGRDVGIAVDVWGAGLVLPGLNTLSFDTNLATTSLDFTVEGDPYADAVSSFSPGAGAGYGQGDLPGIVLGPPTGLGMFDGSLDVLSLGATGEVVLEFVDNVVIDLPGVDFTVFENAFFIIGSGGVLTSVFAEPGEVSVSQDGTTWYTFPCTYDVVNHHPGCAGVFPALFGAEDPESAEHPSIPTDTPIGDMIPLSPLEIFRPAGSGGDSFDLADVGLAWARYVKIVDASGASGSGTSSGFDLDAVAAVNSAPPTDADLDGTPDAVQ